MQLEMSRAIQDSQENFMSFPGTPSDVQQMHAVGNEHFLRVRCGEQVRQLEVELDAAYDAMEQEMQAEECRDRSVRS
jgi:hypothetical protein